MTNESGSYPAAGPRDYDAGAAGFLRLVAGAFGAVFLLVGILGFVPGITTNYGDLGFAGHMSDAKLIGLFQVSVLHNLIHVGYGIVGLAVASRPRAAAMYLLVGGVVYTADNWLHFLLAVAMIALGALGLRRLQHRGAGPSLA